MDKPFICCLCCVCRRMYVLNVYFAASMCLFLHHIIYICHWCWLFKDDTPFRHFHTASHCCPFSLNIQTYSRGQLIAKRFSSSFSSYHAKKLSIHTSEYHANKLSIHTSEIPCKKLCIHTSEISCKKAKYPYI